MTRDEAARKVRLLRQVTTEHGATGPEAATARRMAQKLVEAYRLDRVDPPPRHARTRARAEAYPPRATMRDLHDLRDAFVRMGNAAHLADEALAGFWFDPTTGKGSPNVKVHYHRNVANWKIEILPDSLRGKG